MPDLPRAAGPASADGEAGEAAAPADAPAPSRLASAAGKFWHGTNVRDWVTVRADDAAFRRELAGSDALEAGRGATLAGIERELSALEDHLRGMGTGDPKLKSSLAAVRKHLAALRAGTPVGDRLLKSAINLAVNWFPVLPPSPLMKNEAMTFAYTCAAAMNAIGMVGGSALSSAGTGWPLPFGGGVLGEQANEAHLYPWIIGLQFLPSESVVRFAKDHGRPELAAAVEKFTGQTWWHALLGVAAGGVLAQPLFGGLIADAGKAAWRKASGSTGRAPADGAALAERVGQAALPAIQETLARLRGHASELDELRRAYTGDESSGPEITRALNGLVTLALGEITSMSRRVERLVGMDPQDAAEPAAARAVRNPDTSQKLAYAAVAAVFALYTIAAVQPEVIATIDLSADAAVLIMAMMALALSSTATAEDSRARLLNMASTTMAGAFAFTGDLIAKKGFPEKFPDGLMARSPALGAVAMMLMVALLPRHIANGVLGLGSVAATAGRAAAAPWRGHGRPDTRPAIEMAPPSLAPMDLGPRTDSLFSAIHGLIDQMSSEQLAPHIEGALAASAARADEPAAGRALSARRGDGSP